MRLASLVCVALLGLAGPAFGATNPFSYSVQDFSVPERGLGDDFEDGSIGADWFNQFGTVSESGGGVTLSDPGAGEFLSPFNVESDSSGISGFTLGLNGFGSFTSTSIWLPDVPALGTSYTMALGSQDGAGNLHSISVGVGNTIPGVASELGSTAGLNVNLIVQTRDASDEITAFSVTSQAFAAPDITGSVLLRLIFDDALDEVQAEYSLDGGATNQSFAPVAWNFGGGAFSLVSTSTVPEPSTGLLLVVGLAGIALRRR